MNCSFCGKPVEEGQRFCQNCGAEIKQSEFKVMPTQQREYSTGYQQPAYTDWSASQGNTIGDNSSIIDVYKYVMKNYANFNGRARRREYWMFWLANTLIQATLYVLGGVLGGVAAANGSSSVYTITAFCTGLTFIYALATLIPNLAVSWRRMHDIGKSGAYIFMSLIPLAGPIIVFVSLCTDSQIKTNQYGACPKMRS